MTATDKLTILREEIEETGGLIVAFSGGLDSTFLAAVAAEVLGENAIAVTALSPTYPDREQKKAAELAALIGIRHTTVHSLELELPQFTNNPPDRCYYCKRQLFTQLTELGQQKGIDTVADGTNADDLNDHRPGRRAASECGVISPLLDAGLDKNDIRELSRAMGLPTADKPPLACLASRFPYGTSITESKLKAVDALEEELLAIGFEQVRVRHHGDVARIEIELKHLESACSPPTRTRIVDAAKKHGFLFAALDLAGYHTGSMNAMLTKPQPANATSAPGSQ